MSSEQNRESFSWRLDEDDQRLWKGVHPAEPPPAEPPKLEVLPLTPAMMSLMLSKSRPEWGATVVLTLMVIAFAVFLATHSLGLGIFVGVFSLGILLPILVWSSISEARKAKTDSENGSYLRYRGPISGHESISSDPDTPDRYWLSIPLVQYTLSVDSKVSDYFKVADYFRVPKSGQVTFTEHTGVVFEVRGPNGESVYQLPGYAEEVDAGT